MSSEAPMMLVSSNATATPGWRSWINPAYLPLVATAIVIAVLMLIGGLSFDGYLNTKALSSVLNNNAYLGIAAVGATVVILSGGIDLSIGSAIAFGTILMAVLVHPTIGQQTAMPEFLELLTRDPNAAEAAKRAMVHGGGLNPAVAAIITLAFGTLFGLFMGSIIAAYDLPPFMITLAGMFFLRAAGFFVNAVPVTIEHPFYHSTLENLGLHVWNMQGRRGPIAVTIDATTLVMLATFIVGGVMLHLTSFGRSIYAIGGDEHSAKLLGVQVARTKALVYAISGGCAALAGVIASAARSAGDPADYVGVELEAIAAVVIGGTLLTGGRGYLFGTMLGLIVLALINGVVPVRPNTWTWFDANVTRIVIGALMLAFILLQTSFSSVGRWLSGSKKDAPAH